MVYLIKFARPVGGRALYYIGWTHNEVTFKKRIEHHKSGRGACITRAAVQQGIAFDVVAIIPNGTPDDEKALKRIKSGARVEKRLKALGFAV